MHVGQKISMEKIAEKLGVSKGTVKSYVKRATKKVLGEIEIKGVKAEVIYEKMFVNIPEKEGAK